MNNILQFANGIPAFSDDLIYVMNQIKNIVRQDYLQDYPMIVWGCHNIGGGTISEGVVMTPQGDGELFYHPQTTYSGFTTSWAVDLNAYQTDQKVYADNTTHYFQDMREVLFTPTLTVWDGSTYRSKTYAVLDAERLDVKYQELFNGVLHFSNYGDVYVDISPDGVSPVANGLQLNCIYGKTANTSINLYDGNITMGNGSSGTTINMKSSMQHLSSNFDFVYNSTFNSTGTITVSNDFIDGSGNLIPVTYDRIIYSFQANTNSNDILVQLNGTTIGHLNNLGTVTCHVAAGATLSWRFQTGTTTQLTVRQQKYGNV